jgi:hypothetical protein
MKGLRRHERQQIDGNVWLTWDSGGEMKQVRGKGLDISASGIRLESPEPLPVGSYVNFRIQGTLFAGAGRVCSCNRQQMRHVVGVEFGQGVKWDPQRHPIPAKTSAAVLAVEQ